MTETDAVTNRILLWLQINGYPAWRVGANPVPGRRLRASSRGIGDIIAVVRPSGRHMEIEIKTGTDRPRSEQLAHAEQIRKAGAWHLFIKSFEDFQEQFAVVLQ